METADLESVHALLRVTERSRPQAPHLDNDERLWHSGVNGKNVYLVAADLYVACDDAPTQRRKVAGSNFLAGRSPRLTLRPHASPR